MQKDEVVLVLKEMAALLEVADANTFEVVAYRNASQALDEWNGDLEEAVRNNQVNSIPSIGKGIGQVIADLITTDRSEEYDRVRRLVPEGLPNLLKIRGLGPKRVRVLWQELDIQNLVDLKSAAEDGRVGKLKGFGAKTVERMLSGIEFLERPMPAKEQRTASDISVVAAPKSSGQVSVGMSGYSYPDWKGSFYPEDAKAKDLLEHYAARFKTVEINNTFYRFPTEKVIQQWILQTPDDFEFSLKAHSRITHKVRLRPECSQTIIDFVERCGQLGKKLGCILFQLPPDFRRDDDRLSFLFQCLPTGPRYAIEFRHESWLDESVFEKLAAENMAIVCGDSANSDSTQQLTADFAYVRMRRDDYETSTLADWQNWFEDVGKTNRDVFAYFKHDEVGTVPALLAERWGRSSKRKKAVSAKTRSTQKKKGA